MFMSQGTADDRPRSGVTSIRQDNMIRQRHLCVRFLTAQSTSHAVIGNRERPIDSDTVINRLR